MQMRLQLLIFSLLWATASTRAASWYVDKSASGATNGTSWTSAWNSFSQVDWSQIKPGDVLLISGGPSEKIYTEQLKVGNKGTPEAPIRVALDAQNSSHNGAVIFDFAGWGEEAVINAIHLNDYTILDGNVNGQPKIMVRNLSNYLTRLNASAVYANPIVGAEVKYCVFENVNNAVRFPRCSSISINHNRMVQIRGDAAIHLGSSGIWDENRVYNNYVETLVNPVSPPGLSGYNGPDGIQGASGISVYDNIFRVSLTSKYTSTQHPDTLQISGEYLKVFRNEFVNVGDSAVSPSAWTEGPTRHIWIFDNLFRTEQAIGKYPEYIRMYNQAGLLYFEDIKIVNNTFVDNTNRNTPFVLIGKELASPPGSGNEVKNNIFYNVGNGPYAPILRVAATANLDGTCSQWEFNGNIYYHPSAAAYIEFRGQVFSAPDWIRFQEPMGSLAKPKFEFYSAFGTANDLRLQRDDVAAREKGINLWTLGVAHPEIRLDAIGRLRSTVAAWDIGAFGVSDTVTPPKSLRPNF